ncbi:hypothetical protein I3842_09G218700 [Carya illinoinensis]|uniref:Uncharacterized protein n=1 Tax=Carya illinoinensis TaxID=32201 RepID=A0A922J801_CARIL|nr:hypothetical protein I3842_09G218700 [Carya illinoinensis]
MFMREQGLLLTKLSNCVVWPALHRMSPNSSFSDIYSIFFSPNRRCVKPLFSPSWRKRFCMLVTLRQLLFLGQINV